MFIISDSYARVLGQDGATWQTDATRGKVFRDLTMARMQAARAARKMGDVAAVYRGWGTDSQELVAMFDGNGAPDYCEEV